MKKVRILALTLAVLLMIGMMTAVLTGCGDDKEKTKIYETVGPTTAATTAPTQAATQAKTQATQGQSYDNDNSSETYAYDENTFTDQDAIDNVLARESDGTYIQSYYYHEDPASGAKGWMINVVRADGTSATYFSGYLFCYLVEGDSNNDDVDEDNDDDDDGHGIHDVYYANVSEQDAGMIALGRMGEGWSIIAYSQGTYEGFEAWVVTLSGPDGQTVRAYVNGSDCYFG